MFAAFSSGSFKQEIVVPLQLMPKSILIVVDILLHFVILKYDWFFTYNSIIPADYKNRMEEAVAKRENA